VYLAPAGDATKINSALQERIQNIRLKKCQCDCHHSSSRNHNVFECFILPA